MGIRVRDVMEAIQLPPGVLERTVDGLICGSPDDGVEGIAVTFLASQEIVERIIALGVNLVISHEGIFYSHWDKREMLHADPVYLNKCKLLAESGIAVYRCHDALHSSVPDVVVEGLLQALGWKQYEVDALRAASVVEIPAAALKEIIRHIKEKLGISCVRFVGDAEMPCRRIGLLVGYNGGGEKVIPLASNERLDLAVYGEGPEWETPEYARDAAYQRKGPALVVLGHAESETPGMECFARELQRKLPAVPVHFIRQDSVFRLI